MRTVLVPFHDDDGAEAALEAALRVAERFGGYLEGLLVMEQMHLFARTMSGRPVAIQPELVSELSHEWRAEADKVRRRFVAAIGRHGLSVTALTAPGNGPSAGWAEMEGTESEVVAEYGRLFDLIVIGRTSRDAVPNWEKTCEAALFETGRPVVITPHAVPVRFCDTAVIAWNRSTETARTVGLGMPLLARASQVVVLSVEGWEFPGPSGEELAAHLVRNGINASARTVQTDGRTNGRTILEEATALGADLLVKGAYTHTRFRQMIFGGATREIMEGAAIPVLMAH